MVVILLVFLFDWRTALISLTAIPLSLIAAGLVLHYWGGTLNTMVIAGLVIALGEVVDDAIIDVENILRRLQLNRESAQPQSAFQVVLAASLEVRSAVVYASLIVTLVFVPVLFLDGLAGSFFRPLAIAYILAILASLLVALTVTPALSLMLLPRRTAPPARCPAGSLAQGASIAACCRRWSPVPGLSLGIVIVARRRHGVCRFDALGEEFLPNFQETDFLMHWVEKPGASLDSMRRITVQASKELRAIPGVRNFGSHIGRAEVADEVVGPNFTELWISVDPKRRSACHRGQGASGRRWLSRPLSRPADLPQGTHQGSALRRRGDDRRPRLWAGPGRAAGQGGRNQARHGRRGRRHQSQGRGAGAGAAGPGRAAARCRARDSA